MTRPSSIHSCITDACVAEKAKTRVREGTEESVVKLGNGRGVVWAKESRRSSGGRSEKIGGDMVCDGEEDGKEE